MPTEENQFPSVKNPSKEVVVCLLGERFYLLVKRICPIYGL
jgi:hypothetical protein